MKIIECTQRSLQWYAARLGKVSASNAHNLLTPAKQKSYALELAAEVMTGIKKETFVTEAMQHGIDNEERAKVWYWLETGRQCNDVGLVVSVDNERFIASPDGLVGDFGLVEIKCPGPKNHLMHIDTGPVEQYVAQMQWQMYVCDRLWCDFVSFNDSFKSTVCGACIRIVRDEEYISKLINGAIKVLKKVDELTGKN